MLTSESLSFSLDLYRRLNHFMGSKSNSLPICRNLVNVAPRTRPVQQPKKLPEAYYVLGRLTGFVQGKEKY